MQSNQDAAAYYAAAGYPGYYMPMQAAAHPQYAMQSPMPYPMPPPYPPMPQGHMVGGPMIPQHVAPGPAAAPRPKRRRITPEQLETLTGVFAEHDTPGYEIREKLAGQLDMTVREVQVWFQNRRAKVNRERLQSQQQAQIEMQRQQLEAAKAMLTGMGAAAPDMSEEPSLPAAVPYVPPTTVPAPPAPAPPAPSLPARRSSPPSAPSPVASTASEPAPIVIEPKPSPPHQRDSSKPRPLGRQPSTRSRDSGPSSAPLPMQQTGPQPQQQAPSQGGPAPYPHYGYSGHQVDPYGRTSPHPQYVYGGHGHAGHGGPMYMGMPPGMMPNGQLSPRSPQPADLPGATPRTQPVQPQQQQPDRPPMQQAWHGPHGYRAYGPYEGTSASGETSAAPPQQPARASRSSHSQQTQQQQGPPPQQQQQQQSQAPQHLQAAANAAAANASQGSRSPHGHPLTLPPLWSLGFAAQHAQQGQQSSVPRGPSSASNCDGQGGSRSRSSSLSRASGSPRDATGTNPTEQGLSEGDEDVKLEDA